jgi:hypothetical protein
VVWSHPNSRLEQVGGIQTYIFEKNNDRVFSGLP